MIAAQYNEKHLSANPQRIQFLIWCLWLLGDDSKSFRGVIQSKASDPAMDHYKSLTLTTSMHIPIVVVSYKSILFTESLSFFQNFIKLVMQPN